MSGRRLGRPADTDSTDTRDRIVVCARECFAAEGFEGTTNKHIASNAGISTTALYHYFPSKAEMYVAVCESISIDLAKVFERAKATDLLLERRLTALFAEIGALGVNAPSIVGFIAGISAVVQKHPEVSQGTDAIGADFRRKLIDLIDSSEQSEKVLQGASVHGFADLVASVLTGLGRMSARGEQQRHRDAGDAFLRLIRASLHA
jgi:AcrR family transcriptional regulator